MAGTFWIRFRDDGCRKPAILGLIIVYFARVALSEVSRDGCCEITQGFEQAGSAADGSERFRSGC